MVTHTPTTEMPMLGAKYFERLTVGSRAPNQTLRDSAGHSVDLAQFWMGGPTLLTFLRHFGCIFCREWLSELGQHHAELADAGLQILAVGMGEPKHARRYCGKLLPDATCLVDESALAYGAYGLMQGTIRELASLEVVKAGFRALSRGNMQGRATGDTHMLPGTFIVDRFGIIRYSYYSQHAGDHPAIDELIVAAKSGSL